MKLRVFTILQFFIVFFLQITLHCQNDLYHVKYQSIKNANATPPTYNASTEFDVSHISSDYGRRHYNSQSATQWHRGVDFNLNHVVGDHILSINNAIIEKIYGGYGYKYIITSGEHHFGYGHIFIHQEPPSAGLTCGDMVLKKMVGSDKYAIINITDMTAMGCIDGIENPIVEYNGQNINVTDVVNADQPIAIIGSSGATNVHLHLYMFYDVCLAIQTTTSGKGQHNNITNDRDPMQVISHPEISYSVNIETNGLEINGQHFIDENNVVIFPGDDEISLMVHWEMDNATPSGSRFTNAVMDVDDVALYIKKSYLPDDDYQLITGKLVESFLSHGARMNSQIQPIMANSTYGFPANPPDNTLINMANDTYGWDGSTTRTGIDPYAYRDGNNQAHDDYYFSDFFTRVIDEYNLEAGIENFDVAKANEEAKYKDGIYQLFAKVTTVRGDEYTSMECMAQPPEIIIDNFRPYIAKVKITQDWPGTNEPVTFYEYEWAWNPNLGQLNGVPVKNIEGLIGLPFNIEIESSEILKDCKLEISSLGIGKTPGTQDQENPYLWNLQVLGNPVMGPHTLSITGHDMANNELQTEPEEIPIRQAPNNDSDNWEPEPNPGPVEKHTINFASYDLAFTFEPEIIEAGVETEVYIVNNSSGYEGDNYLWYWFFSGETSPTYFEGRNPPSVTYSDYNLPGTKHIGVIIFDGGQSIAELTKDIQIIDPATYLLVDFEAEGTTDNDELYGNSPLTINFTVASSGIPIEWLWDFGDYWGESTDQNPTYTFENNTGSPQQYTVSLQACNPDDCAVEMKEALITVYPQSATLDPWANFSYSKTSLFAPSTVTFTNTSTGEIDTYEWDLDGNNIFETTVQNPGPQPYGATDIDISLKVTNTDTKKFDIFSRHLKIYEAPNSGYTVDFSWDPNPATQGNLIHFDEDVTGFYASYNCKWIVYDPSGFKVYDAFIQNPYLNLYETGSYSVTLEVYDFYDTFLGVCSKQVNINPPALVAAPGEIVPDDISYMAGFGHSVSIDENFAVVAANAFEHNGERTGAIYIYEFHHESQTWSKKQGPLVPADVKWGDNYACAVGISGNYIVVGAERQTNDPSHERAGAVYVYHYNGSTWNLMPDKLIPGDATYNDNCGWSLSIDGNYLVVGTSGGTVFPDPDSIGYNGSKDHQGKAYIYKLENNTWVEKCKIFDENVFVKDGFGKSVSISGTRIAVGSDHDKAFVFDRVTDDVWEQSTIDLAGNSNDEIVVSVSNNALLIGDHTECYGSPSVSRGGRAYIFEFDNGQWDMEIDLPHIVQRRAHFGFSVSINGRYAVVGVPGEDVFGEYSHSGATYIYRKNFNDFWNLAEKVTPEYYSNISYECTQYGASVYCGNQSIIVGRPGEFLTFPCGTPENFPGTVTIFSNYIYPCDRIISEDDYHPSPNTYPEQSAGYITLGGNPPGEVYFQEGVDIAYLGGDILLQDGFTAAEGCSFLAKGMACAYQPPLKTQSIYTGSNDVEIVAEMVDEIILNADEIINEGREIKLYPNPTSGTITIEGINANSEISAYNSFGKQVYFDNNFNHSFINLSPYPKGIYLLTIKTSEGVFTEKVVLQ